jgi:hypothetical protein
MPSHVDSTAQVDGPTPVTALGVTFHPVDIDDSGIMSIDNGGAPGELMPGRRGGACWFFQLTTDHMRRWLA